MAWAPWRIDLNKLNLLSLSFGVHEALDLHRTEDRYVRTWFRLRQTFDRPAIGKLVHFSPTLRTLDAPSPTVQIPFDAAAREPMEEHDPNTAGDAWGTTTHVQLNHRTDAAFCEGVQQLRVREAAFTSRDPRAGIAAEPSLKPRKEAGALELVVEIGIHFEPDGMGRVDQTKIDHDANRLSGDIHVDPIATVSRCLPRHRGHASNTLCEIVDHFEDGLFIDRKHQKMLRCRSQPLDGGHALIKCRRERNQSTLGNCGILAGPRAPDLLAQPLIGSPVAAQLAKDAGRRRRRLTHGRITADSSHPKGDSVYVGRAQALADSAGVASADASSLNS